MWEFLSVLTDRRLIVAAALAGGIIATLGSYWLRPGSRMAPGKARFLLRGGYAVSGLSVLLFIVAGFLSDW